MALLFWGLAWSNGASGAEPTLSLRADRNSIYLGEHFLLYVELQGENSPASTPDLSLLSANATVKSLGSQDTSRSSISIINGKVSRDIYRGRVYLYSVQPREAGRFTAGPVALLWQGSKIVAEGPIIEVVGVTEQSDVVVSLKTSSANLLVDEAFTVTLSIAVEALPAPNSEIEPLHSQRPPHLQLDFIENEVAGLEGPDIKALLNSLISRNNREPVFTINDYKYTQGVSGFPGFPSMFGDMFEPQTCRFRLPAKKITLQGKSYWEYAITLNYTARQEGDYTFGPIIFKGAKITGGDREGRPLFRDIFAVGAAETVRVVPPPESGRPEWFIGSVGRNMRANATLDTVTCKVGDPLTLTLDITGDISIANMRPPLLNLQPEMATGLFRIYDENIESESIESGKRFRYRLRPLQSGTLEFPALKLAWFDSDKRQYTTIETAPLPLQVQATTQVATALEATGNGTPASHSLDVAQQIAPDGILLTTNGYLASSLLPSPTLRNIAALLLPPLLWALLLLIRALWRRRAEWRHSRQRHAALPQAMRTLRAARERLSPSPSGGEVREAANQALQALRSYLAQRLALTAGAALTAPDLAKTLQSHAIAPATIAELQQLHDALEALAYRPTEVRAAELQPLLAQAREQLSALDKTLNRGSSRATARSAAKHLPLLLLLLLAVPTARAADDTANQFLWERANSAMATARKPQEFMAAAHLYNQLSPNGSGALFYNLGTALLLAEDPLNAEAAFIRAERYAGATPEIRRNWRLALAARNGQPDAQLPASRILLAWHFNLPLHLRLALAFAGWLMLWGGLTLRLFTRASARRRGATTSTRSFAHLLVVVGALLLLLYGASSAITWLQERHDREIWPERHFSSTPTGGAPQRGTP